MAVTLWNELRAVYSVVEVGAPRLIAVGPQVPLACIVPASDGQAKSESAILPANLTPKEQLEWHLWGHFG